MKHKINYPVNKYHYCIDAYVDPVDIEDWLACPNCGLKPKVWIYDNGRSTACGCWNNMFDGFRVYAESIMSVYMRNDKNTSEYDCDGLKKNWNHWAQTGEHLFEPTCFPGRW